MENEDNLKEYLGGLVDILVSKTTQIRNIEWNGKPLIMNTNEGSVGTFGDLTRTIRRSIDIVDRMLTIDYNTEDKE